MQYFKLNKIYIMREKILVLTFASLANTVCYKVCFCIILPPGSGSSIRIRIQAASHNAGIRNHIGVILLC